VRAKSRPRKAAQSASGGKAKARAKVEIKARTPKARAKSVPSRTGADLRIESLRKILSERRREVMREIEGLIGTRIDDEMQRGIDSAPDVGDQALLDSERVRDISILEMRNRVRQQIDDALIRLEEGIYGLCADCGVEISEKRLKAVPFARRCVACQEKAELLEKIEREEEQSS